MKITRVKVNESQYNSLSIRQDDVCALCKSKGKVNTKRPLVVDHNHNTGKIRGLLCHHCNTALGLFKDNPQTCIAAAQYLLSNGLSNK